MKTKYTPGPWHLAVGLAGRLTVETANLAVAQVLEASGAKGGNAALIAAAPELLEALEELLRSIDLACNRTGGGVGRWESQRNAARAAIAKATGK